MPTYDYECLRCGNRFELFQNISEEPRKRCPACRGKAERKIGRGAGIIFKGSGFYATDYRSESYKKDATRDTNSSAADTKAVKGQRGKHFLIMGDAMGMKVSCRECGAKNELGRIFCRGCGARLDLSKVHSSSRGHGRSRRGGRIFRTLFLLLLVAIVGLALWPVQAGGKAGALRDADIMRAKFLRLEKAVRRVEAVTERMTEEQVNGYLAEVVKHTAEQPEAETLVLDIRTINVSFTPDGFVVLISAGWGPVGLTYEVAGVPHVGPGGFEVEILQARLGHLPLPGVLGEKAGNRVVGVFSRMKRERFVLDHLTRLELGEGVVSLST